MLANGQPSLIFNGFINDLRFSQDGSRIVFLSDWENQSSLELYSLSLSGGDLQKLNAPLPDWQMFIFDLQVNVDSAQVVYVANQEEESTWEIFSVPIAGGAVRKLNSPLANQGNVFHRVVFRPDGSQVIFNADLERDGVQELFVAKLESSLVPKSYAEFAATHNLLEPFEGDDDNDGISNGLEYVFATNPTLSKESREPLDLFRSLSSSNLRTRIAQPGSPDVELSLETSNDLSSNDWNVLSTRTNGRWTPDLSFEFTDPGI